MTQIPPGPELDGRDDDHSGLIAALCAILLALALATIGLFHTPQLNRYERPSFTANVPVNQAGPQTPSATASTPSSGPHKPVAPAADPLTDCSSARVAHFFANDPVTTKEGAKSFGPTLVPPELRNRTSLPAGAEGVRLTKQVVRSFWQRLCVDRALANATALTIQPHQSIAITHDAQLRFLRGAVNWENTRLVYKAVSPDRTYTYLMEPGKPEPVIESARYQHGASWFLVSTILDSREEMDQRTECGGQGVVAEADVSPLVPVAA